MTNTTTERHWLRDARRAKGLTQKELADACDLARCYITQVENGTRTPSLHTIRKLVSVLGVSSEQFMEVK